MIKSIIFFLPILWAACLSADCCYQQEQQPAPECECYYAPQQYVQFPVYFFSCYWWEPHPDRDVSWAAKRESFMDELSR